MNYRYWLVTGTHPIFMKKFEKNSSASAGLKANKTSTGTDLLLVFWATGLFGLFVF
jgi:hypothetical protein